MDCLKKIKATGIPAFALMFLSGTIAFSQNFNITNYSAREGLPHNNVRAIALDSTGFMWFGTWDGLSRFDGHEFRNYYHKSNDSTSIPFFSVFSLLVDGTNNLWVLTDHGQLVRYNRAKNNFSLISRINGRSPGTVLGIDSDPAGNLLSFTRSEFYVHNDSSQSFKNFRLTDGYGNSFNLPGGIFSVTLLGDDLWFTGEKALKFTKNDEGDYDFEADYQFLLSPLNRKIDFDFRIWHKVYYSQTGNIWIFSNNGLYKLDKGNGLFREYRSEVPEGEFSGTGYFTWGWKNDGIYIYSPEDNELKIIPGKESRYPIHFLVTGKNTIWYSNSTASGVSLGVNQLVFTPGYFRNYLFTDADSAQPAVYSVVPDKFNRVWTGIRGYNHLIVQDSSGKLSREGFLSAAKLNEAGHVRSILPVKEGIWIGYFGNLLRFFDYKTGEFQNYHPDYIGFRTIAENSEGKILIGNQHLSVFDLVTKKTTSLTDRPATESVTIYKILQDGDSVIYGTMSQSKILKYNILSGSVSVIVIPDSIVNAEDIIRGDENDLWIALLGEGVCRYFPAENRYQFYTTSDGLSNNTTYNLLKDNNGNIWVSTNNGISVIHPSTGGIRTFGQNEGLKISEFNSGAKFRSDKGEFFFGGMGGYVRFYPDSVLKEYSSGNRQRILLTQLRVSGSVRYPEEDLNLTDTIRLEKGENNLRLSFSSTDFVTSERTKFRYRLSGIDNGWIETGAQDRNLNYSNLKPGWYDLHIEATDANGNWIASKELVIRIQPKFYETLLFIIGVPLLIILSIIFSIYSYFRQMEQKQMQIQNELKLQALRGQMNPHFIFNSLNSINYFISNNDRLSANRYIADFSRLIRSILSNLGNNYIAFENELTSIEDYLRIEHLRFGDKFDYKVTVEEDISNRSLDICPGIVQPFIENAIWHGLRPLENRKGFISVHFKYINNNKVCCIIEDDGIGREASGKNNKNGVNHRSKGINIVNERLLVTSKLRGDTFRLEITDLYNDRTETGTKVIVEIPSNITR